jgi:hypothetical protein
MVFEKCFGDQCLLRKKDENGIIILCLYIDDCLACGDQKAVDASKKDIKKYFTTKEEGQMKDYVGYQIHRDKNKMRLY